MTDAQLQPTRQPWHSRGRASLQMCVLLGAVLAGCAGLPHAAAQPERARNVILMIGDGMGDSEITAARNYWVGAAGRLAMDGLPVLGNITTYAVQESEPHLPDYVIDSAASASAWATGKKTSNYRLSTAPGSDEPVPTIVERAQQQGFAVGSVTTADVTDATPAAIVSHVNSRSCQGPADMKRCARYRTAAGGLGSIAEQLIAHRLDVTLGGGRKRFEQPLDASGRTLLDVARAAGMHLVTDADQLAAAGTNAPLLGLFAADDMDQEWQGELATRFPGSGPQRCREQQRPPAQPSLAAMTRSALTVLDAKTSHGKHGFFLQVEGASIDKRDHMADPCGQIGETVGLDAAVEVVLEYARQHRDTLVIITADHGHTSQIVPDPRANGCYPGLMSTVITNEGAQMTLGYATNLAGGYQNHSGVQVRIVAEGPGAAELSGVHDQTEIFDVMMHALGL